MSGLAAGVKGVERVRSLGLRFEGVSLGNLLRTLCCSSHQATPKPLKPGLLQEDLGGGFPYWHRPGCSGGEPAVERGHMKFWSARVKSSR